MVIYILRFSINIYYYGTIILNIFKLLNTISIDFLEFVIGLVSVHNLKHDSLHPVDFSSLSICAPDMNNENKLSTYYFLTVIYESNTTSIIISA